MKAYYGENATKENDWGFDWLPRVTGDHSHFGYWLDMADGKMEGLFIMGQNPAVGAPECALAAHGAGEAEVAGGARHGGDRERFVLVRLAGSGTRRTEAGGHRDRSISVPRRRPAEKDGCQTNTQRLVQYRDKAVDPPGDARSETWFMHHLARRLKAKAAADPSPRNAALNALHWPYSTHGIHDEPNVNEILKEINGRDAADRRAARELTRS